MTKEEQLNRLWEILGVEQYWRAHVINGGWAYLFERAITFDPKYQQIYISLIPVDHCFKSEEEALTFLTSGDIDRNKWHNLAFSDIRDRCEKLNVQVPVSFLNCLKENQASKLRNEVKVIDEQIAKLELSKQDLLKQKEQI